LKLFLEEEDLHLYALVDASESMNFGDPTKLRVAKQLAAALGYVGLCRADRVSVSALGPPGRRAPVLRGRASLWKLLEYLDSVESGHNVSLYEGVKDFSIRNSGTGIAVLISDLMDKQGYESALRMLVGRRMDVFVMHVLSPEEIDPPLRGDRRLIDIEDGDNAEVTINTFVLTRKPSSRSSARSKHSAIGDRSSTSQSEPTHQSKRSSPNTYVNGVWCDELDFDSQRVAMGADVGDPVGGHPAVLLETSS